MQAGTSQVNNITLESTSTVNLFSINIDSKLNFKH